MPVRNPLLPATLVEDDTDPEAGTRRAPRTIEGWALLRASRLDRAGARGLLADMAVMSDLKLQASFCALGTIDIAQPQAFLDRLSVATSGPEGVGEALRTRRARDLIAAVFQIDPEQVPTGYLRALERIEGDYHQGKGKPLARPGSYRRLYEIVAGEDEAKKHALRYGGPITSGVIDALDGCDPVLLHPEVVRHMRVPAALEAANLAVRLMREVATIASDDAIQQALLTGLPALGLDGTLRRWIEARADRFPPPPLAPQADIAPLTSAAQMVAAGREFRNCLAQRIGMVILGRAYYYTVAYQPLRDGPPRRAVVELTPLSTGGWVISTIEGARSDRLRRVGREAIAQRMARIGAVLPTNPLGHANATKLASMLGAYDPLYGGFDLGALEDDADEQNADEEVA